MVMKMSVKNKEIIRLENELKKLRTEHEILINSLSKYTKNNINLLENIIKFCVTKFIGDLKGGMLVKAYEIDKMENIKLDIEYIKEFDSYKIMLMF